MVADMVAMERPWLALAGPFLSCMPTGLESTFLTSGSAQQFFSYLPPGDIFMGAGTVNEICSAFPALLELPSINVLRKKK